MRRFRIIDKESEYYGLECRIIETIGAPYYQFAKVQVLWNTEPKTIAWFRTENLDPIPDSIELPLDEEYDMY